jgi:hypothetical protein
VAVVGHHKDAADALPQLGGSALVRGDLNETIRLEQRKTGHARSKIACPAAFVVVGQRCDSQSLTCVWGKATASVLRAWEIKIGRDAIPTYVKYLYCVPLLRRVSYRLLGRDGDQCPQCPDHAC